MFQQKPDRVKRLLCTFASDKLQRLSEESAYCDL